MIAAGDVGGVAAVVCGRSVDRWPRRSLFDDAQMRAAAGTVGAVARIVVAIVVRRRLALVARRARDRTQRGARGFIAAVSHVLPLFAGDLVGQRPALPRLARIYRSEERRIGKECVHTSQNQVSPYLKTKKKTKN